MEIDDLIDDGNSNKWSYKNTEGDTATIGSTQSVE